MNTTQVESLKLELKNLRYDFYKIEAFSRNK
jgi:hypothetical protein